MYKHILVAVDFSEENAQVIDKAIAIQKLYSSRLSLVHVLEPISFLYGDIDIDVSEHQHKNKETSDKLLNSIITEHKLADTTCSTLDGSPATQLHSYAEKHGVDLIIIGSHGRHGVQLLLGSTANSILHGAQCDVLAVRIQD